MRLQFKHLYQGGTLRIRIESDGPNLILRIPREVAAGWLFEGVEVEIRAEEGQFVVAPLVETGSTLIDMLARVTPQNLHASMDTGPRAGGEVW